MSIAPIVVARVTAQNPPWGLQVVFKATGQGPSYPVTMVRSYADALRVEQKPLPVPGTWGLVAFPYGDARNGVWLGAILPSQMDALTTTQASGFAATDGYIEYESHFSGYWALRDGLGNYAEQYPDGSFFIAGSGTTLPVVYRHTVEDNVQKTIPFTRDDRIPSPPTAYNYGFEHVTGTLVRIDSSGSVLVSGSSGTTYTTTFGGSQATIDVSGNVVVSGATGASLTITFGQTSLTIDASGLATLALPGSEKFNITQGGGSPNDLLVLVSKFLTAFNAHTHGGVQAGGGTTSTPTTPLVSGDVNSAIIGISN